MVALGSDRLGPDPAEALMQNTGEWAMQFLLLTLLVSPLRAWLGVSWIMRVRRTLGLYAFFYACIHLLTFSHFYLGWKLPLLGEELTERPYITAGFVAWLLLLPLALTSTRNMQRRLRRHWQRLHRLVYVAVVVVCAHVVWQTRADIGVALFYSLVAAALLLWRWRRYYVQTRILSGR